MSKWVRWALYSLGFGGFAALVFWASLDEDSFIIRKNNNRLVEIKGSSLSGFEGGVLSWRIKANYLWAGRSKYLFQADEVHTGELYNKDGTVAVDHISARRIRVNTKAKTVSAYKNVTARFIKKEETDESKKHVEISAQELRYFGSSNHMYLNGEVTLKQGDTEIYPRNIVEIDTKQNIAYVLSGFMMKSKELRVSANQLVMSIDENKTTIQGGVIIQRVASPTTNEAIDERERKLRKENAMLTCEMMEYENGKETDQVLLKQHVVIRQGDKTITGESALYDRKNNIYTVENNVHLLTKQLDWILTKEQANFKNKEVEKSMKMPVNIQCQKLVFNTETKLVDCSGDVILIQEDKTIKAKRMIFDDKAGKILAKGRVEVEKKTKEKFYCETLTIDIKTENIDAHDSVMSEFLIKKKKK